MIYYQYFRFMIRCIGSDAASMIDVGSGNAPYLEWFDWIPKRLSVDLEFPYQSKNVQGLTGDIYSLRFDEPFDICTCMQVLEHVPEPAPFAARLLELAKIVLISVPYKWEKGASATHVNDPVDLQSVIDWFGRTPNYHLVVEEPFTTSKGARLFALFDVADPEKRFGANVRRTRRPLEAPPRRRRRPRPVTP